MKINKEFILYLISVEVDCLVSEIYGYSISNNNDYIIAKYWLSPGSINRYEVSIIDYKSFTNSNFPI